MKAPRLLVAASAAVALLASQAAAAQECVSEAEVSALVLYATPSALKGIQRGCAGQLSTNGWMARGSAGMIAQYASHSEESWPRAKRALMVYVSKGMDKPAAGAAGPSDLNALIKALPDEALRPMADAIILQKVAAQIKPDSCRSVERVLELLSLIKPTDNAALIGIVASLADWKELEVCPLEAV